MTTSRRTPAGAGPHPGRDSSIAPAAGAPAASAARHPADAPPHDAAAATAARSMPPPGRLAWPARLAYGAGDLGINFYFGLAATYLLYFYTDVYGLTPAAAASVFLVARLVDAAADPVMGFVTDRTRSRHGRFRPYLLYGALPLALAALLLFTTPPGGESARLPWACATYIAFGIAYTVVAVPYAALTGTLTADFRERTTLSTVRMLCAFTGAYVVSVATLPVVGRFDDARTGFQAAAGLYALVASLLLVLCFARTREANPLAVRSEPLSLRDAARVLLANPPLIVAIIVFMCGLLSFTVRTAAAAYYFKYNVGRGDLIATYFAVTLPVMMAGLLLVPPLASRFGKAGAVIAGAVVTIAGAVGLHLTEPADVGRVLFFASVMALGGAPIAVMGWSMTADTVDYAQWKTGIRADGVIYATATFFQQLAAALGGAGAAAMLAWFGYVANAEQSPASLAAIVSLMTLVPIGIMVVLIVACAFYRLDARRHASIVADLRGRGT
jgi:sugar (glycoside-pentoside-hexuronide) transporter